MDKSTVASGRFAACLECLGRSRGWRRAVLAGFWLLAGAAAPVSAQPVSRCGPANDLIVAQPPADGLCATGSASAVKGKGPWFWTCASSGPTPAPVQCAAPVTAGSAPIPDSRFAKYVRFFGDESNHGTLATQARVDAVVTRTEQSFFMAGFFRPEDHVTWGVLSALQSDYRDNGDFALSLAAYAQGISLFEWRNGPFHNIASAPRIFRGPYRGGGQPVAYVLNQWQFIAAVVKDHCNSQIFLEGVWSEPTVVCVPWPSALNKTTFGSYNEITRYPGDSHVFNGGLRDWAIVTGIPTTEELARMRNGEDPRKIWGASRVWGYWNFTTDPATGMKEPDLTGHGHDLTYIGAGTQDRKKPALIVRER